jgi:hypothetical protein
MSSPASTSDDLSSHNTTPTVPNQTTDPCRDEFLPYLVFSSDDHPILVLNHLLFHPGRLNLPPGIARSPFELLSTLTNDSIPTFLSLSTHVASTYVSFQHAQLCPLVARCRSCGLVRTTFDRLLGRTSSSRARHLPVRRIPTRPARIQYRRRRSSPVRYRPSSLVVPRSSAAGLPFSTLLCDGQPDLAGRSPSLGLSHQHSTYRS